MINRRKLVRISGVAMLAAPNIVLITDDRHNARNLTSTASPRGAGCGWKSSRNGMD